MVLELDRKSLVKGKNSIKGLVRVDYVCLFENKSNKKKTFEPNTVGRICQM